MTLAQKRKIKYWFGQANCKGIKTGIIPRLPEWCKDAPYQIKAIAIKNACQAVKNASKKYINGDGISSSRFRTKKDPVRSCYIPKSAVKDAGIYDTILGELKYKSISAPWI